MVKEKKQSYGEAIAELEKIIQQLQQPDCEVEALQSLTKRGLELLRNCKAQLLETDTSLQKLFEELAALEK